MLENVVGRRPASESTLMAAIGLWTPSQFSTVAIGSTIWVVTYCKPLTPAAERSCTNSASVSQSLPAPVSRTASGPFISPW